MWRIQHGIPRLGFDASKDAAIEQRLIREYRHLVEQVDEQINAKNYSADTLKTISAVLAKNPEYYTFWNHRRRILQHLLTNNHSDSDAAEKLLTSDLKFLVPVV